MIHSDENWEQLPGEMRSTRWGVPQKVLEKCGMKKKSVKFKLRSTEGGGVKQYAMKLWSAESGGVTQYGLKLWSGERGRCRSA
jgi:hypothetical protein